MGTRRKSRELALQMLFQSDMGKQDAEQVRKTFWAEHGTASAEVRGFADDLFRVATDRLSDIDGLTEKHTAHWRMELQKPLKRFGRLGNESWTRSLPPSDVLTS